MAGGSPEGGALGVGVAEGRAGVTVGWRPTLQAQTLPACRVVDFPEHAPHFDSVFTATLRKCWANDCF